MTVVCYGDSNTYGYDPRGFFGGRYDEPWPELLGELTGWTVLNCGSCGREIPTGPIHFPGNGDLLIVMLGTNDLLQGATAAQAGERMYRFLRTLDHRKLLLLAPPPMAPGEWVSGEGLILESRALCHVYRSLAGELSIRYLDPAAWDIPMAHDGVHFTQEGHRRFARNLAQALKQSELRT